MVKEEYNRKMKEYRDSNKFMNAYHCHNYKRRNRGLETISIEEYIEYRKYVKTNCVDKLRSSPISRVITWENYKLQNDFFFPEPKMKGNFTDEIKKRISEEL